MNNFQKTFDEQIIEAQCKGCKGVGERFADHGFTRIFKECSDCKGTGIKSRELNEAPTEKEKLIARNTKFVLYAAFFMATFLYIAGRICS